MFAAPALEGPWSGPREVYALPDGGARYSALWHPELSRDDARVLVVTNCGGPEYMPYFIEVHVSIALRPREGVRHARVMGRL